MPPELRDWLDGGVPIPVDGLPDGSVLRLDVEQRVRDLGGYMGSFSQHLLSCHGMTATSNLPACRSSWSKT